MTDSRAVWAEFVEVLRLPMKADDFVRTAPWAKARFATELPILDIGAGTGHGTLALGKAFPSSEIVAVEPDQSVRAVLMLRIAERTTLRKRVTVLHQPVLEAPLPNRCGGAVLLSVIYFLAPDDRRALWRLLASHLVAGGAVLMNRAYGAGPVEPIASKRVSASAMGRQRYERWFASSPQPDGSVQITNRYQVLLDGNMQREVIETTSMVGVDERVILDEIPTDLFDVEELSDRYLVMRRKAR